MPIATTVMPFGKYKGIELDEVPASYLMWLYENDCKDQTVKAYIVKNMDGIKKQIEDGNDAEEAYAFANIMIKARAKLRTTTAV